MYGQILKKLMGIFIVLSLVLSGCDFGLDYNSASTYCRDQYVNAEVQIDKIESNKLIQKNFKEDVDDLVIEPLKLCYMAGFICRIQCHNLDPKCQNAFYEAVKYCSTTPSIPKSVL